MGTNVEFRNKFRLSELTIHETQFWVWSLRPEQVTLGAGVLSLKRDCAEFSRVYPQEFCDLSAIVRVVEYSLKDTLNYDVINYLMLMMYDKQVHFHIIPRYKHERFLFERKWEDKGWPGPPNLQEADSKINLLEIKEHIKAGLWLPLERRMPDEEI